MNSAETLLNLHKVQSKLIKQLDGSLSPHGISFTEFIVLRYLRNAPENTMRRIDLAESIGLTASGVTRLLNPLEKIGLISKEASARDARVSLVKLTTAGTDLFNDADKTFTERSSAILERLTDAQLTTFSAIANRLL